MATRRPDRRRPPTAPPKIGQPNNVDLAPLTNLDPEALVPRTGNDRLASFMLALAVVFNDLKGLSVMHLSLAHLKPTTTTISPELGNWSGLDLQIHRMSMGLLHECLTLIETFSDVVTVAPD
jgi:hypothetical protein